MTAPLGCPSCEAPSDEITEMPSVNDGQETHGSISICAYCAALYQLTPDGFMPLLPWERRIVLLMPETRRAIAGIMASRHCYEVLEGIALEKGDNRRGPGGEFVE